MSDLFLANASAPEQKRPTYAEQQKAARRRAEESIIRNQKRSRANQEADEAAAREAALSRPLFEAPDSESAPAAPQNKALSMMMKMGFKPGQALGAQAREARIEPLKIDIRDKRTGLGIESTAEKRRKTIPLPKTAAQIGGTKQDLASFIANSRAKYDATKADSILRQARRTLEELDRRQGIESSVLWLDPAEIEARRWRRIRARRMGEPVSDDEGEELEGDRRPAATEEVVDDAIKTSRDQWLTLDVHARLAQTLNHLRTEHHYCLWCGCAYNDDADLDENCPGEDEDAH